MTEPTTLRSFPPLLPPTRPKKSPSPRLAPRRRSSSGGGGKFSLTRLMGGRRGGENNENGHQSRSGTSGKSPPLVSRVNATIRTSPMESSAKKKKQQQQQQQLQQFHHQQQQGVDGLHEMEADLLSPPLSPSTAGAAVGQGNLSPASSQHTGAFAMAAAAVEDEDSVPLTPRNLVMEATDAIVTLTPPANAPMPLIVSAKRLGCNIRRTYSTKRRRPLRDDNSSSSSDEDETMKIPQGLSPSQQAQEYWKRCYGQLESQDQKLNRHDSWSAKRAAPIKSCLSHSKPKRKAHTHILLPPESALIHSPPLFGSNDDSSSQGFSTPRSSPDDPQPQNKCSHAKSVQFGVAQAAEYERDAPSGRFTPLPAEIAQERFPLTNKQDENEGEQEEIAETKVNSAMLAEWESEFDSFMDDSEETENDLRGPSKKRHSSKKDRSHKKHRKSCGGSNNRSDRRQSSAFCSPRNSKVLYDPSSDTESTPDKQNTVDDLAGLSMNSLVMKSPSPSPPAQSDSHDEMQVEGSHRVAGTSRESVDMSPAVDRNLSAESETDDQTADGTVEAKAVSQCEEPVQLPEKRIKADSLVLVNNIWDATALLSQGERCDPRTVFSNLALTPRQLWDETQQTQADIKNTFETGAASWHASVDDPFETSLNTLSEKTSSVGPSDDSRHNVDTVPRVVSEKWERVARYEWKKLELEFYQDLQRQIQEIQAPIVAKAKLVDFLDVPSEASREPTRKHRQDAEKAILGLIDAIAEEKKAKEATEHRRNAANLQCNVLRAPFSALSYQAIWHVSPFDVAISRQRNHAVFNHLLQGLETTVELDGSMDTAVCQASEGIADGAGHDLVSKFYNSMLCSSSSGSGSASELQVQEGFMELVSTGGAVDMNDQLLQLAVLLGRVDLAALSLQQIAAQYDVSLVVVVEEGHPVIVARIKLPEKTTVNVFYRRRDLKSVSWSLPSNVFVDRDGQPVLDLVGPMDQMMNASAEGILGSICRQVQRQGA